MIKGLAGGVLAGTAAAGLGLAVLSQMAAPPVPFAPEPSPGPAAVTASPAPDAPPSDAVLSPEAAAVAPVAPSPADPTPAPVAQAPALGAGAAVAEAPAVLQPSPAPVAGVAPALPSAVASGTPVPGAVAEPVAPVATGADAPALAMVPAEPPVSEPQAPGAMPPATTASAMPEVPAVAMAEATQPLPSPLVPQGPAPTDAAPVAVQPPAGPGPVVQATVPDVPPPAVDGPGAGQAPPAPAPSLEMQAVPSAPDAPVASVLPPVAAEAPPVTAAPPAPDAGTQEAVAEAAPGVMTRPAPLAPAPGLSGAEGVRVGRLPRIAAEPAAMEDAGAADVPLAEPAASDETAPPLRRFARMFENPAGKPLFSVVLIDTGGPALDRVALAGLPFPVTFALDPTQPGADLAASIYRDGGQEVVILVPALPAGANASDIEVNMAAMADTIPEAVAVLDVEEGGFQTNRVLAGQVVPVVGGQGRGLLSWDRGLNAAAQVARREGVAAATILRRIDGEGESAPIMRRYLDRAAFKAAQDGRVVVAGTTRPETVAVLLEWAVEGRASSVALAPVSAVVRP